MPEIDAATSHSGRITAMSQAAIGAVELGTQAARAVRDALDDQPTPPDGQPVEAEVKVSGAVRVKKHRSRRPGWPATVGMCIASMFAGTPVWSLLSGSSAEIGELRGRQAALEQAMNSNAAADLKRDADRAVEWRELDAKIVAVAANVDAVLVKLDVPPERRRALPETSAETLQRHRDAESRWRAALTAAQNRQIEQALADSDTVAPP